MRSKDAKPTPEDLAVAARIAQLWEKYKRDNMTTGGKAPTQNAIIEATGLSQSAISQYLGGRLSFGYGAVLKFANFFGVSPREIHPNLDALPSSEPENDFSESVGVKAYAQAVGLGSGPAAQEYAKINTLFFRRDSIRKKNLSPSNLSIMYGDGDSMEPTIKHGDAILFDLSDTSLKNKGIYVITDETPAGKEYQAKRYYSRGGGVFIADNQDGDHGWKDPRPASEFEVIGRVKWVGGWVK